MSHVQTTIVRGLPDSLPTHTSRSGHHWEKHGMSQKGKAAALAVLKHGVGNHSVTHLTAAKNILQSFTTGARQINKKHGDPLRVSQRKTANGYDVIIMFKSDLPNPLAHVEDLSQH